MSGFQEVHTVDELAAVEDTDELVFRRLVAIHLEQFCKEDGFKKPSVHGDNTFQDHTSTN